MWHSWFWKTYTGLRNWPIKLRYFEDSVTAPPIYHVLLVKRNGIWKKKGIRSKLATSWQNQQNDLCAQQRLRSAWASAQSDQSLHCLHEETLRPPLPIEHPGWSESSLGPQSFCWFCHEAAQFIFNMITQFLYEPHHQKTCLLGLRPGKTQTGQRSHRSS